MEPSCLRVLSWASARELILRRDLRTCRAVYFTFGLQPIIELAAGRKSALLSDLMRTLCNARVPAFLVQLRALQIRVYDIGKQRLW